MCCHTGPLSPRGARNAKGSIAELDDIPSSLTVEFPPDSPAFWRETVMRTQVRIPYAWISSLKLLNSGWRCLDTAYVP